MFHAFQHLGQPPVQVAHPRAVAVLPLGALETHGPHLPLATDTLIAEGILDCVRDLDRSAEPILRLPPLWVGASAEHADRAGTVSIEPEMLIAQIESIGEGLARAGVKRILLFNGHGGNIAAAAIAVLKLRTRFGMLAACAHWLDYGLPDGMKTPAGVKEDVHGGWIETSVMLHLAPALVGKGAAAEPKPPGPSLFPSGPVNWGWMTSDLVDGGWIGRADLADVALGEAMVNHAARAALATLHELAAAAWRPAA
ncbi:MAG: creatininase family protein [Rhodospirillaceae bacterium]|nr:creatininase family protein [Rhodospirillaceae bacterium]